MKKVSKIKSVMTKKIQIKLFLLLVLVTVTFYLYFDFIGEQAVPPYILLVLGLLLTILALYVYYAEFFLPINKLLEQMKSLLSGRKYKKVFTERTDEIGILAHFFNEVTDSFEYLSKKLNEGKKVTGELQTAGQLQQELMPIEAPSIPGFDIAVKNRSAEELGGDNLDFIKSGSAYYFYIGDVTGHGVPAAIIMTMVNTLINAFSEIYDTALEIVVQTNRRLKMRIRSNMFMSMLMLKWDDQKKKMTYVGCGHEHLIIYRASTGKCDVFKSGGIALGMIKDNSKIVKEIEINLSAGDVIVMYTDGITEAKNMQGEMFGLDRLVEFVTILADRNDAISIIQEIAKKFSSFVEEHVQEDDVTLAVIKSLGATNMAKSSFDNKKLKWNEDENNEVLASSEAKPVGAESVGDEKTVARAEENTQENVNIEKPDLIEKHENEMNETEEKIS